jgi:hypothetical protein
MAQIGISIVKRVAFRLHTQEFANTYHYGSVLGEPDVGTASALIDEVTAAEKLFHSSLVSFVFARLWTSGGSISSNHMILEKALTGTGSTTPGTAVDPERAVLIQWPAGLDSRGRAVYLRKWYHALGNFGSVVMTNNLLTQQIAFTSAERTTMANLADANSRIGTSNEWGLVAESGRTRNGGVLSADPPIAHPYFEHHQLGDQWRG